MESVANSNNLARIAHVPLNTPYVTNLSYYGDFLNINANHTSIPPLVTLQNFLEHSNDDTWWKQFDIIHIHFGLEFEKEETVDSFINIARTRDKVVCVTVHELESVHNNTSDLIDRLKKVILIADFVICLTNECAESLLKNSPQVKSKLKVIPHGPVIVDSKYIKVENQSSKVTLVLFGGMRSNRALLSSLLNASFTVLRYGGRLRWITKPICERSITPEYIGVLDFLKSQSCCEIVMKSYYSESELCELIGDGDALILPYTRAGHSGQLELALDLGIVPIVSSVGYLAAQISENTFYDGPPPVLFFDWSDQRDWEHPARLMNTLEIFFENSDSWIQRMKSWRNQNYHRRMQLHRNICRKHAEIYRNALDAKNEH